MEEKLNLAQSICREVATLSVTELSGKTESALNPLLQSVLRRIDGTVTQGLLDGSVILKPYFSAGKLYCMPVRKGDYKILEQDVSCGKPLVVEFYEQQGDLLRVERHTQLTNEYIVTNFAMYKGRILETMPDIWRDFAKEVRFPGRTTPLYGYFETPDGKPFCEKATKLISEAEKQFERLLWEFESGNRALYVADTAFFKDRKGNPKLPDKRLYRLLNTGKDDLFCDYSPVFRQKDIADGFNVILERIEDCCGLSRGTVSDINHTARTATELKISRHRTYATVKWIQRALQNALSDMLQAAKAILFVHDRAESDVLEHTSFAFDDTVLTGKTDEITDILALLDKGVFEPQEVKAYLMQKGMFVQMQGGAYNG